MAWVCLTGGIKNQDNPMPPVGRMQGRGDFAALADDWKRLQSCLSDPTGNHARPLEEPAQSLVAQLCGQDPQSRPSHSEIREHAFMAAIELPPMEASSDDLLQWARCSRGISAR